MTSRSLTIAWLTVAAFAATVAVPGQAAAMPPWQSAQQVKEALFDAQASLLLDDGRDAQAATARARAAFEGRMRRTLAREAPGAEARAQRALADARTAAAKLDAAGLATARGALQAAIFEGSYRVTLDAIDRGRVSQARAWLLVRDFRKGTRFSRPGIDATRALVALERGRATVKAARLAVRKDLLDAYQARLNDHRKGAREASDRGFETRRAEQAALVAGYWEILRPEYREQRGAAQLAAADRSLAALGSAGLERLAQGLRRPFGRSSEASRGLCRRALHRR